MFVKAKDFDRSLWYLDVYLTTKMLGDLLPLLWCLQKQKTLPLVLDTWTCILTAKILSDSLLFPLLVKSLKKKKTDFALSLEYLDCIQTTKNYFSIRHPFVICKTHICFPDDSDCVVMWNFVNLFFLTPFYLTIRSLLLHRVKDWFFLARLCWVELRDQGCVYMMNFVISSFFRHWQNKRIIILF